jgi:isopentenyl diphosphate isomerase/L-lactate dehydrogenase-like FMN-dependent dehydrogenase
MFGEKQFDEIEGPHTLGPQSLEDLKKYREATSLPFIVKGVLSVQDAKISKEEIDADAIVVSTHGGEALDYAVPILKVLPEIREIVGKEMCILADSGFRRGTDVLKALALGADGVCFGSMIILAFVAYGRDGVANMLNVLYSELQRAMTLTGSKNISEIDPSIIRFP